MKQYLEIYKKTQELAQLLAKRDGFEAKVSLFKSSSDSPRIVSYFEAACDVMQHLYQHEMADIVEEVESREVSYFESFLMSVKFNGQTPISPELAAHIVGKMENAGICLNLENRSHSLCVERAQELIDFSYLTNTALSPFGDGLFGSQESAVQWVLSDEYDEYEPLCLCFEQEDGEWESVQVAYQNDEWLFFDVGMGGQSATGESLEDAYNAYRDLFNDDPDNRPIELKYL